MDAGRRAVARLVVAVVLVVACGGARESELRKRFLTRQNGFMALLTMAQSDKEFRVIDLAGISRWDGPGVQNPDRADPASLERLGLPLSGWRFYADSFARLGISGWFKDVTGRVYFRVETGSLWNGDSESGIVYLPSSIFEDPEGLSPSADKRRSGTIFYRRIEPHWYMYRALN